MNPFLALMDAPDRLIPESRRDPLLPRTERAVSVSVLIRLLSKTLEVCETYDEKTWRRPTPVSRQLRGLIDRHRQEQFDIVDLILNRIETLGGPSIAADAHNCTLVEDTDLSALLAVSPIELISVAHLAVVETAKPLLKVLNACGDCYTKDLVMRKVVRVNELQNWSIGTHFERPTMAIVS